MEDIPLHYLGYPPWATRVDFSQPPPPLAEERRNRWVKIGPVMSFLRAGVVAPNVLMDDIPGLLGTLKEEGNAFFVDKEYFMAYDMYTVGVIIVSQQKEKVLSEIDWRLISALFSNRAACLFKMDYFKACIKDCDVAIRLNVGNLKAQYRKAQALKALGDYVGAKVAADDGRCRAEHNGKASEVKDFDDLLCEINSHPPSEASVSEKDAKDVPGERVLSVDRKNWWENFTFIRPIVWGGPISRHVKKEFLSDLMENMAKEASSLLAERNYRIAQELCSGVLIVARHLEMVLLQMIGRSFLSKTFVKRAICAHKMDAFDEALNDCELALQLDYGNAEAMYRKALVAKAKKCYKEAFGIATDCRQMALEKEDIDLVKRCDILVREAHSHLMRSDDGHLAAKSMATMKSSTPDASFSKASPTSSAAAAEVVLDKDGAAKGKKRWRRKKPVITNTEEQVMYIGEDHGDDTIHENSCDKSTQVASGLAANVGAVKNELNSKSKTRMDEQVIYRRDAAVQSELSECLSSSVSDGATIQASESVSTASSGRQSKAAVAKSTGNSTALGDVKAEKAIPITPGVKSAAGVVSESNPEAVIEAALKSTFKLKTSNSEPTKLKTSASVSTKTQVNSNVSVNTSRISEVAAKSSGEKKASVSDAQKAKIESKPSAASVFAANMDSTAKDFAVKYNIEPLSSTPPITPALLSLNQVSKVPKSSSSSKPTTQPVKPVEVLSGATPAKSLSLVVEAKMDDKSKKKKKQNAAKLNVAGTNLPPSSSGALHLPTPSLPPHRLACSQCFKENSPFIPKQHDCREDMLLVQNRKNKQWLLIRKCEYQNRIGRKYVMCWHVVVGDKCPRGISCTFAHNEEELVLWNLQSKGRFRIEEFIANNRTRGNVLEYTVEAVYRKYNGHLRFICGSCYREKHLIITQDPSSRTCDKNLHDLRSSKLLAHRSKDMMVTTIGKRPFANKVAYFNLCSQKQFCRNKMGCIYAHSEIERDIWYMERDTGLKQDEIISEWYRFTLLASNNLNTQASSRSTSFSSYSAISESSDSSVCPFEIAIVCSLCLKNGRLFKNPDGLARCENNHSWNLNFVYVVLPSRKIMKPLPKRIPQNNHFTICRTVLNCYHGNNCQFAHSDEEILFWKWMVENKVTTLDAAFRSQTKNTNTGLVRTSSNPSIAERRRSSSSSNPVWTLPIQSSAVPSLGREESFYCYYCCVTCNSQAQLEVHCSSARHLLNVNSDKDHQWNFHQPPWNVIHGNYRLCIPHLDGRCRYSNVPATNNLCTFAHSQEELDEWIERYRWRVMKRQIAVDENLFSYMDKLVKDYNESGSSVLSEELEGVSISCTDSLIAFAEDKNVTKRWKFLLKITKPGLALKKVALLHNESRLHFALAIPGEWNSQLSQGDSFRAGDCTYHAVVVFNGGIYGSFTQSIVFDFGQRPVLVRKMSVEVGRKEAQEKVKKLKEVLHLDRWTTKNRMIVNFPDQACDADEFTKMLLTKYKAPSAAEITQQVIGFELNQHNYKFKMHGLISIEEMTQTRIVSEYNVATSVTIKNCVGDELSGFSFSQRGELFAQVPLANQLIEGSLISMSVVKVLIAPYQDQTGLVYEAVITEMENRVLRGSDFVFLTLSAQCCKDLSLKNEDERDMEVQFQINRSTFSRLHFAIDQLKNVDLLFPDIRKLHLTNREQYQMNFGSSKLNDDQKKILAYVSTRKQNFPPPFVAYGPFGTGKTETLAEAAILLATSNSDVRILICTLTHQAADEYILRHFHPFLERSNASAPMLLRIYDKLRKVITIDPIARKYSLLSSDHSSFRDPNKDDVLRHRIVVTTVITSLLITRLDLRGCFTHIFIDEAAQVNECHTLIPLCLADEKTCIVLTGDHIQMAEQVYSPEARDQHFDRSLVERLMGVYESSPRALNEKPKLLLTANYRNHPAIVRFVAKVFYGAEESLKAMSVQPVNPEFPPLSFYAAYGCETRSPNSTSFYNEAEVREVVEQVKRVLENWPKEWGERRADQVLVTSPFDDQVRQIRSLLRKQTNRDLAKVVVLRVQNVPGREFRVVFMSTVLTRNVVKPESSIDLNSNDTDLGFLSNHRMVNSAFTRAKSYLAVIGDPVALCSIGVCSKIWHQYFKYCAEIPGSIKPPDLTLTSIRLLCDAFMATQDLSVNNAERENEDAFNIADVLDLGDWDEGYQLEPDDIIRQLVTQTSKSSQPQLGIFPDNDGYRAENIRMQEREGHAVLYYRQPERRRNAVSAANVDDEYDSLSDEDNEVVNAVYNEIEPKKLKSLAKNQPEKYRRCTINIESSKNIFARPLDAPIVFKRILITSRLLCGRAFHGDEVVVEILRVGEPLEKTSDEKVAYGKVIGILKQVMNPNYRQFVCTVEEGNSGMMVPINKGIPKIYNLELKERPRPSKNTVSVYKLSSGQRIVFDHFEKVNQFDTESKLFVVRFLKWEPKFWSPLGIVVAVIPPGRLATEAMRIVEIEHNIPTRFRTETEEEVHRLFPSGCRMPESALKNRHDFRDQNVFTIDPATSTDLDDALSFEELSSDQYQVIVHIADVSYFVKKHSKIDNEALRRGATFYQTAGQAIHMLPPRLSSDLCSLLPNQDRLTMSVIMTINGEANIKNVKVERSVIRSKYRLNYEQVEEIIQGNSQDSNLGIPEALESKILNLDRIAQEWRQRRLGSLAAHHSIEPDYLQGTRAHLLVEELMIAANHQVALLLMDRFPLLTPLRNQLQPNELELDEWRQRFRKEARNSVALTRPFLDKGKVCLCPQECKCIPRSKRSDSEKIELLKSVWETILTACSDDDPELLRTLVVSPEYHPQLSIAMLYLHFLSEKSQYVCSSDLPVDERSHFSLNLSVYTHFTSPIRRYFDIIVHRLIGCMIDGCLAEYSQSEITNLCLQCTDATRRAQKFEDASRLAHVCQLLRDKPIVVSPVIEKVNESGLSLTCPTLQHLLYRSLKVRSAWLQPSRKPGLDSDLHQMLLKWSLRMYDPSADALTMAALHAPGGELNPDRFIVKADSAKWRLLLLAVVNDADFSKIAEVVSILKNSLVDSSSTKPESYLSSELLLAKSKNHFCEFSMQFRESGVVRVQLSTKLSRGLLLPTVQLLSLTKSYDICVEHRQDPVSCFASTNAGIATKVFYPSIDEYQDLWLPVLAIEAAHSAVTNDIPAVIRNVEISWRGENYRKGLCYVGIFKLDFRFCVTRSLKFPMSRRPVNEDEDFFDEDEEACSGYFCIRYSDIQAKTPNTELNLFGVDEIDEPFTWVGHCSMMRGSIDDDKTTVSIQLRLNPGNSQLPMELLEKKNSRLATVEWISKPLPDCRMERAVNDLDCASKLAKHIALGLSPGPLDRFYLDLVTPWLKREAPAGLCAPNITQRQAIEQSLRESFSLIQGPPGTGKTVVAVQLAYLFRKINSTLPDSFNNKSKVHPQVMCCGPSNKSVDVIAGHLLKIKIPETVIIRVYSEKVEREDFPIPRHLLLIKKKYRLEDQVHDKALREISLHHMIRDDRWNPCSAKFLRQMDERIRNEPEDQIPEEEIKEYQDAVKAAEQMLLGRAHIILLTCSSSGSPRLHIAGVNVYQLIIDECGMCMEPESLIPIVSSKAKQVVLLGDHQQLQPIVLEAGARKRGLGQSMFERYAKKAFMLTTQYRMHEAIAAFPSKEFYLGKLTVGTHKQTLPSALSFWPAGGAKPIAFVHSVGKEEALTVDTEEGGEQSKMNMIEVAHVVFIVRQMVDKHRIPANAIGVLSQYRAQSTEISKKLLSSSTLKDVTVQTVVAAQGSEWDYVVLSTVRSLPEIEIEKKPNLSWKRKKLGFVADSHQINVAITRAKKGLVIVGNKLLLECDEMWRNLIRHYEENHKVVDVATFRRSLGDAT